MVTIGSSNPEISIKTNRLEDISDVVRIEQELKAGHIMIVQTDGFFERFEQDLTTLKASIDRLKDVCIRQGGNIARIGSDLLVLSPSSNVDFY